MSEKDLNRTAETTADSMEDGSAGTPSEAETEREMSVEDAFARLDELIRKLEKPDQTLEASFQSYAEGMKLVQFCNDALDEVEKKVLILSRDGEVDEF